MKDLELRGAGNLLGAEQSGFVAAIGLDTYTRLLEDTIRPHEGGRRRRCRTRRRDRGGCSVPPRMGTSRMPRRNCTSTDASPASKTRLRRGAIQAEIRDRYGPLPAEVARLLMTARLRLLGTALGIERDSRPGRCRPGHVPRRSRARA
jgi:transcription-repair coupling factor (superfamily II helicase)